jgi:hypothetical protein
MDTIPPLSTVDAEKDAPDLSRRAVLAGLLGGAVGLAVPGGEASAEEKTQKPPISKERAEELVKMILTVNKDMTPREAREQLNRMLRKSGRPVLQIDEK